MIHAVRARHAVWAPIQEAVRETVGPATPLYRAAIRGRVGKDPGGVEFAALASRLPGEERARLLASLGMFAHADTFPDRTTGLAKR